MPIDRHDFFLSLRRTFVPLLVGGVAATSLGPWIPGPVVAEFATVLLAAMYYTVLRLLELRVPKLGVLLGGKGVPHYEDPEAEMRAFQDFLAALKAVEDAGEDL